MIKKIKFTQEDRCIPSGFEIELENLLIITGENNAGKTTFINAINNKRYIKMYDENDTIIDINSIELIHFPCDNVSPANSECKASASNTNLIKKLTKLFSELDIDFQLDNREDVKNIISDVISKTNNNLKKFTGSQNHELEINFNDNLKREVVIQAIIDNITCNESGRDVNLDKLGQGTQRIIVSSILKSYKDLLKERGLLQGKKILILFEEPEIYLHPKLKRTLNNTLEEISKEDNIQIIITTHDPYFAFKNMDDDKVIYSFIKENNVTKLSERNIVYGIEDELLYIWLYNKLEGKLGDELEDRINDINVLSSERIYYRNNGTEQEHPDLVYIRHQIHHLGDNPNTLGLIAGTNDENIINRKNYYTEDELRKGINIMCKMIGE